MRVTSTGGSTVCTSTTGARSTFIPSCSSHLLRRGQVAMECEQPIDLTAFLIGGNEQRDGCVSHSTTREVIDKVDCVVRWVKVMVTGLVHEPADKLLSNHILQVTILVVITYIFNDNQLT